MEEKKRKTEIDGRRFKLTMEEDVIKYIAGFIVYKLKRDIGEIETQCEWIDLVSDGVCETLVIPCTNTVTFFT